MPLYPPYIESKLPAQVGDTLSIPFQIHRNMLWDDNIKVRVTIRTATTGKIISNKLETTTPVKKSNEEYIATFEVPQDDEENKLLSVGQHYKIQLILERDDSKEESQSSVGSFKYTSKPTLTIVGLDQAHISEYTNEYIAQYTNSDSSEKLYSIKFYLYKDGVNVHQSQEILHSATNDDIKDIVATERYSFNTELEYSQIYFLQCEATTINGFTILSPAYLIQRSAAYNNALLNGELQLVANNESGCVELYFKPLQATIFEGAFKILRTANGATHEIYDAKYYHKFSSNNEQPLLLFRDYTIESGIKYTYGLQKYNSTVSATPIYASIIPEYDDMFLSDGERCLNIKFNPKVTSFKTTLQETKTDTIGGRYSFFYRNGRLAYKEFPISGLISAHMDAAHTFIEDEIDIDTNLTAENFAAERAFKLNVLNWLNNGKPKIFRSPAEGCYIVRLMNTSLSPNDTLGRMLHTFSSTAYEIAEFTTANLLKYKLFAEPAEIPLIFEQITLSKDEWIDLKKDYGRVVFARLFTPWSSDNVNTIYEYSMQQNDELKQLAVNISEYHLFIPKEDALASIKTTRDGCSMEIGYYPEVDTDIYTPQGVPVVKWDTSEYIEQWDGGQHEFSQPENINVVFLRICSNTLEPNNATDYSYTITWIDGTETEGNLFIPGRVEYTLNDFNGRFTFKSLKLGSGLYADICYILSNPETGGKSL